MGPGRWGSNDINLGVRVSYSDINNTRLLVEIAFARDGYTPEVSYGTHFFQDLVEADIAIMPLYPDTKGSSLNEDFLLGSRNAIADVDPGLAASVGRHPRDPCSRDSATGSSSTCSSTRNPRRASGCSALRRSGSRFRKKDCFCPSHPLGFVPNPTPRGVHITTQQWIALAIFVLSYGLIISEKVNRTIAAIVGALLAFAFVLGPENLLRYENWETILFIFGMMAIIETLSLSGFFRWLGLHSAKWVKLDPLKLFILFPFVAGFLSAFVDSITVMLFMSALTIEVAAHIKINPLPLILSEICAANIGGASTMVGDPPNVILGTYFQLSFMDFVRNTGPDRLDRIHHQHRVLHVVVPQGHRDRTSAVERAARQAGKGGGRRSTRRGPWRTSGSLRQD